MAKTLVVTGNLLDTRISLGSGAAETEVEEDKAVNEDANSTTAATVLTPVAPPVTVGKGAPIPRQHVTDFGESNSIDLTMHQLYKVLRWGRSLYGMQLSSVGSLFSAIDSDGDGFITKAELQAAFRRLDISESEAQVEGIMREICKRSDGLTEEDKDNAPFSIDLSQFVTALAQFGITNEVIGVDRNFVEAERLTTGSLGRDPLVEAAAAAAAMTNAMQPVLKEEKEELAKEKSTPSVAIIRETICNRYCEDYETIVEEERAFLAGLRDLLIKEGGGGAEGAPSLSPEALDGAILSIKFFFEAGMHAEAEAEARASLGLDVNAAWPSNLVFPRALQVKESTDQYSRAALALERERQEEYQPAFDEVTEMTSSGANMVSSSSSSSSSPSSSSSSSRFQSIGSSTATKTAVKRRGEGKSNSKGMGKGSWPTRHRTKTQKPRDEGWDVFFKAQSEADRLVESLAGSIRKRERYHEKSVERSASKRDARFASRSRQRSGRSASKRFVPSAQRSSPRSASPSKRSLYDGMSFEDVERAVQNEGTLEEKTDIPPLSMLPANTKTRSSAAAEAGGSNGAGNSLEPSMLGRVTPKPLVPGISISDAFDADSPYHPMVRAHFLYLGPLF